MQLYMYKDNFFSILALYNYPFNNTEEEKTMQMR